MVGFCKWEQAAKSMRNPMQQSSRLMSAFSLSRSKWRRASRIAGAASSLSSGKHDVVTLPINSAWARTYVAHVGTSPRALCLAPPARHPVVFFLARFDFAEPLSANDTCQLGAILARSVSAFGSARVKKNERKKPFLMKRCSVAPRDCVFSF